MHLVGIEVGAGHDRAAAADDLDPRYGLVGRSVSGSETSMSNLYFRAALMSEPMILPFTR